MILCLSLLKTPFYSEEIILACFPPAIQPPKFSICSSITTTSCILREAGSVLQVFLSDCHAPFFQSSLRLGLIFLQVILDLNYEARNMWFISLKTGKQLLFCVVMRHPSLIFTVCKILFIFFLTAVPAQFVSQEDHMMQISFIAPHNPKLLAASGI